MSSSPSFTEDEYPVDTDTSWRLFFCCGRFVQYKATSLEKQHKHELLTEPDLGVTIDLINPDTYRIDPNSKAFSSRVLL